MYARRKASPSLIGFVCLLTAIPLLGEDARPDMVRIPAGEFWMGRTQNWLVDELGMHLRPRLDDQPVHRVYLDSYWIDRYEVTNRRYARFIEATGRRRPFHWIAGKVPSGQEEFPVYNVTWDDAVAYCGFVGRRLPTEAEWERAARGGVEKSMYPWGSELGTKTRRQAGEQSDPGGTTAPEAGAVWFSERPGGRGIFCAQRIRPL